MALLGALSPDPIMGSHSTLAMGSVLHSLNLEKLPAFSRAIITFPEV